MHHVIITISDVFCAEARKVGIPHLLVLVWKCCMLFCVTLATNLSEFVNYLISFMLSSMRFAQISTTWVITKNNFAYSMLAKQRYAKLREKKC